MVARVRPDERRRGECSRETLGGLTFVLALQSARQVLAIRMEFETSEGNSL